MKLFYNIVACFLSLTMGAYAVDPDFVYTKNLALPMSQRGLDLITYYEVGGGRASYEKSYARPIVPAWQTTSSGCTIMIGLDCGFLTKDQIRTALTSVATEEEIQLLQSVSGMKGKNAYYNGLPKIRNNIRFNYDQAQTVFMNYTLPSFTKQTANAFVISPDKLSPDSNSALVSLVYNRGPDLSMKDSRKEMRWIKYNLSTGKDNLVPSDIRSMKRLWSYATLKGLHLRRDAEAKLFENGLKK